MDGNTYKNPLEGPSPDEPHSPYPDADGICKLCGERIVTKLHGFDDDSSVIAAARDFVNYLSTVNTPQRQSIIFSVPDDDTDGVALAGFCERLTRLCKALEAYDAE